MLRAHATCTVGAPLRDLQFVSTSFFRRWVETIVNTLTPTGGTPNFDVLVELYGDLFQGTIIVDAYYTSSSVYLPPSINLDLLAVCAYSGYIHSCGSNVFIRKMDKTRKEHIFQAVQDYLGTLDNGGKKVFFTVYSHEDFTEFDRDSSHELRDGLDDVKIYVEKFFLGRDSLVSVLRELKRAFASRLEIPDPGEFRVKHKEFRQDQNMDATRTLWLIKDSAIDARSLQKTADSYFICYDQRFVNENYLHIFDENKPAWISHTTIPHTLVGAMINIAKPSLVSSLGMILCDPFAGSGTTWLEGLKYPELSFRCSDLSPIAELLAQDNAEFFSQSLNQLNALSGRLKLLAGFVQKEPELGSSPLLLDSAESPSAAYRWAFDCARTVAENSNEPSTAMLARLREAVLFDRIVFYLALRTRLRNIGAFQRESKDWRTAYVNETWTLVRQVESLTELRKRQKDPHPVSCKSRATSVSIYQGKYSLACCPATEPLRKAYSLCKAGQGVGLIDACTLEPNSCHLVVTDPPYGFNTNDEPAKLAELWTSALRAMILALVDGGQLVLCLPDQSHTGRDLQYFTQREFITHQVLSIAASVARETVIPADVVPSPARLFRPPFYWESERALRRAILHFTFWNIRIRSASPIGQGQNQHAGEAHQRNPP